MTNKYSSSYQPGFFDQDIDTKLSVREMSSWPDQSRFPINISQEKAGKTLKNENPDSSLINRSRSEISNLTESKTSTR